MPRGNTKKEKAFTEGRTSTASHTNGLGDAGHADRELSRLISGIKSLLKIKHDRKQIEALFGSMDEAWRTFLTIPELRKAIEDSPRWCEFIRGRCEVFTHKRLDQLIAQMSDVLIWKTLAASDPKKYRFALPEALREYKRLLNFVCRIESHRPKNETQTLLIWEIKTSKPGSSFGQVAREYTKRTGRPMSAKIAERTYARAKPNVDFVLDWGLSAVVPYLKHLEVLQRSQNTTKA